mgnify:CR=1 FL=1
MDVDKWDYLMRDSMYCGVKVSCDINRLRNFSKVGRAGLEGHHGQRGSVHSGVGCYQV